MCIRDSLDPLQECQAQAIREFLQPGSKVQLLQGPPGTGKSLTITTLLLMLRKLRPDARVVVSAPSNAAVQQLAARFLGVCEAEGVDHNSVLVGSGELEDLSLIHI
eukprot:TRINITY_DN33939_c0_g1_i1.p1 TRINITY_DN33939_c0_g1~~TRINITY_DN33939_c0_g1_i1.p1  ORF type:complete len:106 (+),score=36.24 TRINITY_DN33939_c0_g1_i1:49-366(+)